MLKVQCGVGMEQRLGNSQLTVVILLYLPCLPNSELRITNYELP